MSSRVSVIRRDIFRYPSALDGYGPSTLYPEYLFNRTEITRSNEVYDMVRESFIRFGLDRENYGTSNWNPLGCFVKPGERVLIKPNLVRHYNGNSEGGIECLITNPSLVAAVIDYVLIALKGRGTIVIGDAPLQECDFEELISSAGYAYLIDYYKKKGINIELKDFRNTKTYYGENGIHFLQENRRNDNGIVVALNEESWFYGLGDSKIDAMRVTDYDPRIMRQYHTNLTHKYEISKELLKADVVINMPKPKTHRKAGITASLKNLIGINSNKECLPHHTNGSIHEGGDSYLNISENMKKADVAMDKLNIFNFEEDIQKSVDAMNDFNSYYSRAKEEGERYYEGSWYGNDTIWRTIADLNRIFFYADKNGVMTKTKQRKQFIVADMIIAGHKEGPLDPTPYNAGIIACGSDPVWFDRTICKLMGFDYKLIPSLNISAYNSDSCQITNEVNSIVVSNDEGWNNKYIDEIENTMHFVPTKGWECLLGNEEKERLINGIKDLGAPVIIFGAGEKGRDLCLYLREIAPDIRIISFFDNDPSLWGKTIIRTIKCEKPFEQSDHVVCVVAVGKEYRDQINEQIKKYGFEKTFVWCDEENRLLV